MKFRTYFLMLEQGPPVPPPAAPPAAGGMPPLGGPTPPMGGGMPGDPMAGGMPPAGGGAPATGKLPTPTIPKHANVWEVLEAILKHKKLPDEKERLKMNQQADQKSAPAAPQMPPMGGPAPPMDAGMGGPPAGPGLMGL